MRLAIQQNERDSYVSQEIVTKTLGWNLSDDNSVIATLVPWRSLPWLIPKSTPPSKVKFLLKPFAEFKSIHKRELPRGLRIQLAANANIADAELLWKEDDESLPVHGTLGFEALRILQDSKKMKLASGLTIRSTILGDYMYGHSHSIPLPSSVIEEREKQRKVKKNAYMSTLKYLQLSQLSGIPLSSMTMDEKQLVFPEWLIGTPLVTSNEESEVNSEKTDESSVPSLEQEEKTKEFKGQSISYDKDLASKGKLTNEELNKLLRNILEQQLIEFKEWDLTLDEHNQRIMDEFKRSRKRLPDGRYQVTLPWNERVEDISTNEKLALDRLVSLVYQFKRDPDFYNRYKEAVEELIKLEVIKKVNIQFVRSAKKAVFFPHHCVSKPDRITTKDRVVWDGSAHEKGKDPINRALEEGPNLLPPLQSMLMNCRQGKYMVTGDLKKAFFQVALDPEDKVLLFMYWWEENLETNQMQYTIYWFVRLPWGLNCSPFILQAAIRCHGEDHLEKLKEEDPEYSCLKELLQSLYIDDIIKTYDCLDKIKLMIHTSNKYLGDAGWEVVKTRSNNKEVNELLQIDPSSVEGIKLLQQKVLGIIYDIQKDTFRPNVENIKNMDLTKPLTPRRALSALHQMYDPLRFLGPWLLTGQLLFQKTQRKYHHWDQVLDQELQEEWLNYLETHKVLADVSIPREAVPYEEDFEVHIFADACIDGYAAVAYAVWKERNMSNILIAMTRVVPDKLKPSTTINRLELNGAVLATLVSRKIQQTFNKVHVKFTYWLDSMVSLWWIHSNKPNYQIYITNRIKTILEHSTPEQWKHVPGLLNPADYASRGIKAEKLKNLKIWFHGPEFLLNPSQYPKEFNASVKPPELVHYSVMRELVPLVEDVCTSFAEHQIHAMLQDPEPIKGYAATFVIQMGNSTIEKLIPRLPHVSKNYSKLLRTIVYVARSWKKKSSSYGLLKEVSQAYQQNNPFATNPYEKKWKTWKKSLAEFVIMHWAKKDETNKTNVNKAVPGGDTNQVEENPHRKRDILTSKLRIEFTSLIKPPHHRSMLDPKEVEAAEEALVKDVQKHYFPNIYEALLQVHLGATMEQALVQLTAKEKDLIHKNQVIMDHRKMLMVAGRLIHPTPEKKEMSLVHSIHQYYQVKLGSIYPRVEVRLKKLTPEEIETSTKKGSEYNTQRYQDAERTIEDWMKSRTSITRLLILMPNRGLTAESIMREAHNQSGHAGINYAMSEVTRKFWIIKPARLFNHVKSTCFMCRFFANKLWHLQEGLLPKVRVTPTYPFQYVGVDIAGPLFRVIQDSTSLIKKRKTSSQMLMERRSNTKFYAMLFVCAATRAVDIQMITSLSTASVVNAFESFVSTRGRPSVVLSDNAPSFEESSTIIQKAIQNSLSGKYVTCKWIFIPTRSPWWGGQYEIFVRLMKRFLEKFMPDMRITSELHAVQVLKAAEGCINSRPLYAVANGINDLEVITPMHFLRTGFQVEEKYFPVNVELPLNMYKQLKSDQSKQVREMWLQLHQAYLNQLRKFHVKRGCYSKRPIKVGDIVLIKNEKYARNFWPLARIVEVFTSRDGIIRQVRLQKYLPNKINTALRESKYNIKSDQKLTTKQIQELMGYFETMKRKFEVKNLVPYEMWKGSQAEPEDMDDGQISVCFQNAILKGSREAFVSKDCTQKPASRVEQFLNIPSQLLIEFDDVWTTQTDRAAGTPVLS